MFSRVPHVHGLVREKTRRKTSRKDKSLGDTVRYSMSQVFLIRKE